MYLLVIGMIFTDFFDKIAQDDEGFEITSFGGSLDDEEDARSPPNGPAVNGAKKDLSPKPVDNRHSLDGETIFAVGEDADKWSDDESPRNSQERTRLIGKDV